MSDGATKNPHAVQDSCPQLGRTGQHHFIWRTEETVVCSHCGEIRYNTTASNSVIQPGVVHANPVQS